MAPKDQKSYESNCFVYDYFQHVRAPPVDGVKPEDASEMCLATLFAFAKDPVNREQFYFFCTSDQFRERELIGVLDFLLR